MWDLGQHRCSVRRSQDCWLQIRQKVFFAWISCVRIAKWNAVATLPVSIRLESANGWRLLYKETVNWMLAIKSSFIKMGSLLYVFGLLELAIILWTFFKRLTRNLRLIYVWIIKGAKLAVILYVSKTEKKQFSVSTGHKTCDTLMIFRL